MTDLDPVIDHAAVAKRVQDRFCAAVVASFADVMSVKNDLLPSGLYSLSKATGELSYYLYAPADGEDAVSYILGEQFQAPELEGDKRTWPKPPAEMLTELSDLVTELNQEESFNDIHSIRVLIQGGGDCRVTSFSAHVEYHPPTGEEELAAGIQ